MSSVLSLYAGNTALSALLHNGGYLACHTSDPTVVGVIATEVAGGGYARKRITFTAPGSKTAVSANAQTFTGMPACTVTHLAVWTTISGDTMLFSILLPKALAVLESGQLLCAAGDIAISL